jgi:hypothetical protein
MTCIYILKINNNNIGYYFDYNLAQDFLYSCYYANFIKDTDNVVIETFKQNTNIKIESKNIYFTIKTNNNTNNKTNTNTNTKTNTNTNDNDLESFSNSSKTTISDIFSKIESDSDSDYEPDTNYISSECESDSTVKSVESTFSEFMKKRENNKKKTKLMNEIGQEKIDVTYHINLLKQEKKKLQEKENEYNYDLELYKKFRELKETNTNFKIPELFVNKYNIFLKLEESNELSFDNFIILYQPEVISTDYDSMFSAPSHYKLEKSDQVDQSTHFEQEIEELEELDQTYEQLNKKYEEIDKTADLLVDKTADLLVDKTNKKCEDFVDETYDNLFIVSHNLSSKPEQKSESELKSDDIQRITSSDDNYDCNCNSSSSSDSD